MLEYERGFLYFMKISEKELQELIYQSKNTELYNSGLDHHRYKFIDFNLGVYGIAPVILVERIKHGVIKLEVLLIKNSNINSDLIQEAIKLKIGLVRYLLHRKVKCSYFVSISIINHISDKTDTILEKTDLIDPIGINIIQYELNINGLVFKNVYNNIGDSEFTDKIKYLK